ncbi:phasin family protein [Duganella aquatilis]|nr:phasin family protein [Duganella aquatilis]
METLIGFYVDVMQHVIEATQSVSQLNMQLGRDLITEAGANGQRIMSSKDAGQLGSAFAILLTPGRKSLATYQHRLAAVLSRSHAGITEVAASHMPGVQRSATAMTEQLVQEATAHSTRAAEQLARFQPGGHLRH